MTSEKDKNIVKAIISRYAEVYQDFEKLQPKVQKGKKNLQTKENVLPSGDQKTGVIGEYYAKCYIESLDGVEEVDYSKAGDSFDLSYKQKVTSSKIRVQVKCVSAHSKTRTIAPLRLIDKNGQLAFDLLYLIALDINFKPVGFYINKFENFNSIANKKQKIVGLKMQMGINKGSSILNFEKNMVDDLNKVINID